MSDETASGGPHDQGGNPYAQSTAASGRSRTVLGMLVVMTISLVIVLLICGMLAALIFPAIQRTRDLARRVQDQNNLKQIGLALHNYYDTYGALPAAHTVDQQGRPLLSWRASLAPYLGAPAFDPGMVDWDQPWDSPRNASLMESMPSALKDPRAPDRRPGYTTYHVIELPPTSDGDGQSLLQPDQWPTWEQVPDGLHHTIAVVSLPEHSVPWTQPGGLSPEEVLRAMESTGGANMLMGDGSVRYVTDTIDHQVFGALATRDGSE